LNKYGHLSQADLVATLTYFTADCIVRAITTHVPNYEKYPVLIGSGGGTQNKTLMNYLKKILPSHMRLAVSDEYGIPSPFKESVLFAILGYTCINQIGNNIPHASGASAFTIMGHLVYPPRFAKGI
jgi:anhydro-N-acetylmuramic acid kinase